MSSDNPSGADNQQERPSSPAWLDAIPPDLGHYVAGFVDGEGSFNVPIRRERDRGLPYRVSLSFNVSQVGPKPPSFCDRSSTWEQCEAAATVSSTSKSRSRPISKHGSSRSSIGFRFVARS